MAESCDLSIEAVTDGRSQRELPLQWRFGMRGGVDAEGRCKSAYGLGVLHAGQGSLNLNSPVGTRDLKSPNVTAYNYTMRIPTCQSFFGSSAVWTLTRANNNASR